MQCVRELRGVDVEPIKKYLSESSVKFERSQLYSSLNETKFVDENLRKSKFRTFTDPVLFDLCDAILTKHLRDEDENKRYHLVRNDITHIIYRTGDFFARHKDYLSLTSNVIEEYTLIICVTPEEIAEQTKGGKTLLHLNRSFTHKSKATTTPGYGLLFRKDIEHESKPLKSGEKHIITMNIWATPLETDQLLVVTFQSPSRTFCGCQTPKTTASSSTVVSNASNSQVYTIPLTTLKRFPHCMLSGYIRFLPDGMKSGTIITYACNNCTYEEFGIIYNILNGISISEESLTKHTELIRFHNLFDHNILSHLARNDGTEMKPSSLVKPVRDLNDPFLDSLDIIVCASEARTKYVMSTVLTERLPYVPFKVYLCEGTLSYGGDMSSTPPQHLEMLPVWVSLGDYENVFAYRALMHLSNVDDNLPLHDHDFKNLLPNLSDEQKEYLLTPDQTVYFVHDVNLVEDESTFYTDKYAVIEHHTVSFDLTMAVGKQFVVSSFLCSTDRQFLPQSMIVLPGGYDDGERRKRRRNVAPPVQSPYFHLDSKDCVCFSESEALMMTKRLIETDFVNRVAQQVTFVDFELPQHSSNFSHHFCNENVYGHLNFLLLSGVVRVEKLPQ
eukprot:c6664_g1_i1.p1 GENE.c6664_g1_i1~~c6664_g1_i1.p1  ORF type:complete len:614 (+),score=118.90 c6664_g1_i1:34-1875(+)